VKNGAVFWPTLYSECIGLVMLLKERRVPIVDDASESVTEIVATGNYFQKKGHIVWTFAVKLKIV